MARWDHVERFVEGDEVVHRDGRRGVIFLTTRSQKTGKRYPKVRVLSGSVSHEWPSGWEPLLDRDGEQHTRCRCNECDRPFMAPDHVSLCRQCKRRFEAQEGARVQLQRGDGTGNQERDALTRPWRLREETKTTETSTAVAEPKHPEGCRCGWTKDCTPF